MPTPSEELQKAVYDALIADAGVSGVVGSRVSDGRPTEYPCITFGAMDYIPNDAACITGRAETMQLDCWTRDGGRARPALALADLVKAAIHYQDLSLGDHAMVSIRVDAVRGFMDADGLTAHGVVTVTALIEER